MLSINYIVFFFGEERTKVLLRQIDLLSASGGFPDQVSKQNFLIMGINNINITNDEGHGWLTRPVLKWTWGMLFATLGQSASLSDALKRFCELLPTLNFGLNASLYSNHLGAWLSMKYDEEVNVETGSAQYLEVVTMVLFCALLWCAKQDFRPLCVRVPTRLNPEDGLLWAGVCECYQENAAEGITMGFRADDLAIKLGKRPYTQWGFHEAEIFKGLLVTMRIDEDASEDLVADVSRLLEMKPLNRREVAEHLEISEANLQRRLSRLSTSFREISRRVQKKKLVESLSMSADIDQVASQLGYSDRRSLARACLALTGMTPTNLILQLNGK